MFGKLRYAIQSPKFFSNGATTTALCVCCIKYYTAGKLCKTYRGLPHFFRLFCCHCITASTPPTYFQICRWRANSTRRSKECGNPTVARYVPVAANASFRRRSMCTAAAMIRSFQQSHKLLGDKVLDPPT